MEERLPCETGFNQHYPDQDSLLEVTCEDEEESYDCKTTTLSADVEIEDEFVMSHPGEQLSQEKQLPTFSPVTLNNVWDVSKLEEDSIQNQPEELHEAEKEIKRLNRMLHLKEVSVCLARDKIKQLEEEIVQLKDTVLMLERKYSPNQNEMTHCQPESNKLDDASSFESSTTPLDLGRSTLLPSLSSHSDCEDESATNNHIECENSYHGVLLDDSNHSKKGQCGVLSDKIDEYSRLETSLNQPPQEMNDDSNLSEEGQCLAQSDEIDEYFQLENSLNKPPQKMNELFNCDICGERFSSLNEHNRHIQDVHRNILLFKCAICEDSFYTLKELEEHNTTNHSWALKCSLCKTAFETIAEGIRHFLIHVKKLGLRFQCKTCGRKFINKHRLEKHKNCVHLTKKVEQNRIYHTFKELEDYRLVHRLFKLYTCDLCGRKSHSFHFFRNHLNTHLDSEYKCRECGRCFKRITSFQNHQKLHSDSFVCQFICQICGKRFATRKGVRKHEKESHSAIKYKCDLCNLSLSSVQSVAKHLFSKHVCVKNLICHLCGNKYRTKGYLRLHVQRCQRRIDLLNQNNHRIPNSTGT